MAAENRWADHPLAQQLTQEGPQYPFFHVVQLIQAAFPDAAAVGRQGPPEREVVRFRVDPSLGFADSDISRIEVKDTGGEMPRFEITTTFLGLYGASSPLPSFYTEDVLHQDEESLTRPFVDLFHHRLLSLFYRTWEKYRYQAQFQPGGSDLLSRRLLHMLGLGPGIAPHRTHVPPVRLLGYLGLLTQLPGSASVLRSILADYFDPIGVEIEQCSGAYIDIAPAQRTQLGVAHCTLGVDAMPGSRLWDRSASFTIRLGPMGVKDYLSFLPPGSKTAELREMVDLVNSDALDYILDVWIHCDEIPELRLSANTARLGWSTWLGRRPTSNPSAQFPVKGRLHG